jgi:hypothetical protein
MSKHTPGEWSAGVADYIGRECFVVGLLGTKKLVAVVGDIAAMDEEESIANARLISAAPDLLAALQLIHALAFDVYEDGDQQLEDIVLDKTCDLGDRQKAAAFIAVRAAIAKATGETK